MARSKGWPRWKHAVVLTGLAVACIGLWVLAGVMEFKPPGDGEDVQQGAYTFTDVMRMLSLLTGMLFAIFAGWHGYRYYKSIPAWKRGKGLPPRH